jgi:hypothetical protein
MFDNLARVQCKSAAIGLLGRANLPNFRLQDEYLYQLPKRALPALHC